MLLAIVSVQICVNKGVPSSRLDKKQTINLWKRHMLCDSVLIYGRNCWEFGHFVSPASVQSCVAKFPLRTVWMKILEMKTTRTQLAHAISCFRALHHRWHFASSSSGIWTLFMKSSLEGPESEEHEKKNTNTNKNTTMTRAPANFFRKCEKFAKDKVIYGKEGLEYWNTAKERRNLRSFDMKTSPHRDAIFFLRVSWIVLPKWARVAYFPRKDSLKLNRSVKTPWHRSSMGVERSK